MQGVDLIKLANGEIAEREQFFYEHTFLGSPKLPKVEAVVSPDLKYMYYPEHDFEELFDIKNDHKETNNLVNDSAYSDRLKEQRKLYKILKQQIK